MKHFHYIHLKWEVQKGLHYSKKVQIKYHLIMMKRLKPCSWFN